MVMEESTKDMLDVAAASTAFISNKYTSVIGYGSLLFDINAKYHFHDLLFFPLSIYLLQALHPTL